MSALAEMTARSGGFLSAAALFDTGLSGLVALQATYHPDRFSPDLFAAFDQPRPDRLATATAKRQAEYLAGRVLIGACLDLLGLPLVAVGTGAGGAPLWPFGVAGTLSHAGGRCVCMVAPDGNRLVGADTETLVQGRRTDAIRRLVLTPAERALIGTAPPEADLDTLIFSAKETLFKLLYPRVQRHFGFHCAELRTLPANGRLQLFMTQDLHTGVTAGAGFWIHFTRDQTHVTTWAAA